MLLTFKIVLSSLCIGFGLFGGVLSPALLIGSCVGAMIYYVPLLGISENLSQILAVSGMAAVASSIIGGPITAVVLVLISGFQSWTKADDIRDFQIEGMSIGDSLLDFYSP